MNVALSRLALVAIVCFAASAAHAIDPIDFEPEDVVAETQPLAPGTEMAVSGINIRVNGCRALDIYEGPGDLTIAALLWSQPASREEWLQRQFDRVLARFDGDLWGAFVELGGGLRHSTGGFQVEVTVTDVVQDCEGFELPVLEVDEVVDAYDLDSGRLIDPSQPLSDSGLDPDDPQMRAILEAGLAGLAGYPITSEIEVEGVTDRTLGCPLWALGDTRAMSFNCRSGWGFVDLRYATPELAPDPEAILFEMLLARGEKYIDDVRRSRAEELQERARRAAARGPYRYRGRFTGEVTIERGTEALFLTPVFVVEALIEPDPEAGGAD